MSTSKSFVAKLIVVAVMAFGFTALSQPVLARTGGNPMAVFDGRIEELLRELTVIGNASPSGNQKPEYRALLIRVAQMRAYRPNLARLPKNEQWDCISYWVETASKVKKDHHDDDDDEDDEDDEDS